MRKFEIIHFFAHIQGDMYVQIYYRVAIRGPFRNFNFNSGGISSILKSVIHLNHTSGEQHDKRIFR